MLHVYVHIVQCTFTVLSYSPGHQDIDAFIVRWACVLVVLDACRVFKSRPSPSASKHGNFGQSMSKYMVMRSPPKMGYAALDSMCMCKCAHMRACLCLVSASVFLVLFCTVIHTQCTCTKCVRFWVRRRPEYPVRRAFTPHLVCVCVCVCAGVSLHQRSVADLFGGVMADLSFDSKPKSPM